MLNSKYSKVLTIILIILEDEGMKRQLKSYFYGKISFFVISYLNW